MKVLITGANGFIGSYLVKRFLKKKYNVYGMVRKTSDLSLINDTKVKLIYADIRKRDSVIEALKDKDLVIHNAALARDWGKYETFYNTNVIGTANIFEAAELNKVKRLIYFSTISQYGICEHYESDEETPRHNSSYYYCITKADAEKIAERYMWEAKVKITILQPGVVFGPDDRMTTYQLIDAIANRNIGYINKGEKLFSPIYIDNFIDGVMLAIKKKKSIGRKYILTDGIKITWKEFIEEIARYLNVQPPSLSIPYWLANSLAMAMETGYNLLNLKKAPLLTRYRISTAAHNMFFSNARIKKELDFKSLISINEGIRKSVKWYKSIKKSQTTGKLNS